MLVRWRALATRLFSIDARSLALLRIGVAGVILLDLVFTRFPGIPAFYADDGMFPIALSQGVMASPAHWSLHELGGSASAQAFLLAAAGCLGTLLLLGCCTRTATIGSWALAVSLANRNPMVCNYGDSLLQLLLFWNIWIPWGETWSVDAWLRAARGQVPRREIASVATACAMLQLAILYFFAGLWKLNDDWLTGTAVQHALALEYAIRDSAHRLLDFPEVLRFLTHCTLALELFGPLLVWSPWRTGAIRLAMVVGFIGLHVGIEIFFTPVYLSHICIVAWSLFVPGTFWEWPVVRRLTWACDHGIQERAARAALPDAVQSPLPTKSLVGRMGTRLQDAMLLVLMTYVVLWNLVTFDAKRLGFLLPERAQWPGHALLLRQTWDMFWTPSRFHGWIEARARLPDGTTVDVLGGGRPLSSPPSPNWSSMPNPRWKVFFRRLAERPVPEVCQQVAEFQWKQWNECHAADRRAVQLDLVQLRWREGVTPGSRDLAERVVARVESPEANSWEEILRRLQRADEDAPFRP